MGKLTFWQIKILNNDSGQEGNTGIEWGRRVRDGDQRKWCLLWAGDPQCLGATLLSSFISSSSLTLRAQRRNQVFHPPGSTTFCPCRTWDALGCPGLLIHMTSIPDFHWWTEIKSPPLGLFYEALHFFSHNCARLYLYISQLEFMQILLFFSNLKSWICLCKAGFAY